MTTAITPLYTATVNAIGGRAGHVKSDDGTIDLPLAMHKSMGGPGTEKHSNPEQLFAAGYAACCLSALKFAGHQLKLQVPDDVSVTATAGIGTRAEGGFGLEVDLAVALPGAFADPGRLSALHADIATRQYDARFPSVHL